MAYEFKFPFNPPWEDLKLQGETSTGAKFYVFDSCVEKDPEKRAEIDQRVGLVLARAERQKFLRSLNENA